MPEGFHTRHVAISNPHLTEVERNDVTGERNEVFNLHLSGAEEYEFEAGVEEADDEIDKEVEDDGGVVSTVQGDNSPAALRGIRQQCLAGAARFRNPPLGLPKLHSLPLSPELHCAGKNGSGEEFSHSHRLVAPPICRSRDIGFPALRRSGGSASLDEARIKDVGAGGGVLLQESGALKSQNRDQSTRGLGSDFQQRSALVKGSFISDDQNVHPPRYAPETSKKTATPQDRGGSRRTMRTHHRVSRQRAQAMIDSVSKRESSAISLTTTVNALDRPTRSYAEVATQIPEGTHHSTSGEDTRREAQRRHRCIPPAPYCLPKIGRGGEVLSMSS